MMRLTMRSNVGDYQRRLAEVGRQAPFVAAVSLTRAVKDAQAVVKADMSRVFDRPTAYALNGTLVKPATKQKLEAKLWVKDNPFGKGTPADRFLGPQIFGGVRGQKGMERALQAAGLMPEGWIAVPAAGAQLDANGNVRRGQITQVLSQLRAQLRAGYESRSSDSAASKRTVSRQGVTYFALPKGNRGLLPGVYLKRRFAAGTAIRPVFLFAPSASYKPRWRFMETGRRISTERFRYHFDAEIDKAIASARLRSGRP